MSVGWTFRKLVKIAAVVVAVLPSLVQAFIPLHEADGSVQAIVDNQATFGQFAIGDPVAAMAVKSQAQALGTMACPASALIYSIPDVQTLGDDNASFDEKGSAGVRIGINVATAALGKFWGQTPKSPPVVAVGTLASMAVNDEFAGEMMTAHASLTPQLSPLNATFNVAYGGIRGAYSSILKKSIIRGHYPKAEVAVFGKSMPSGSTVGPYFEYGEEMDYAYMYSKKWGGLERKYGREWMWEQINRPYVDAQWNSTKEIIFTHNPWDATKLGGVENFFEREVYRFMELGAQDFIPTLDGRWKLVR